MGESARINPVAGLEIVREFLRDHEFVGGAATITLSIERIAELETELTTLRQQLEWRDISTAPKDGTPVLLAMPWRGSYLRYVGHYGLYGWLRGETGRTYFTDLMQTSFSRWMPLPPPPKEADHG